MNTETQIRLHHAETEYQQAKTAADAEQAADQKQKLKAAMREGRALQDEFRRLEHKVRRLEQKVTQAQNELNAYDTAIAEHRGNKPQLIDFPTPEEEAAWEQRHTELLQGRAKQVQQLRDIKGECEQARFAAVKARDLMERSRQEVRNLQNKIEGDIAEWPKGGASSIR